MIPELEALGVPPAVQEFFGMPELIFNYGSHFEHFGKGFHRVPTTPNIWLAGQDIPHQVIVTSTAMEAIAYLSANLHRHPNLDDLTFIALGNLPQTGQLKWIRAQFSKQKFTLVFGNDLLGRLADIRVAAGLKGREVRLLRSGPEIEITCGSKIFKFAPDRLSLNAFELAAGIRTGIRTAKPKKFDNYLEQLKHHAKQ